MTEKEENASSDNELSLGDLPRYVHWQIFSFLAPRDLCRLACTSTYWRDQLDTGVVAVNQIWWRYCLVLLNETGKPSNLMRRMKCWRTEYILIVQKSLSRFPLSPTHNTLSPHLQQTILDENFRLASLLTIGDQRYWPIIDERINRNENERTKTRMLRKGFSFSDPSVFEGTDIMAVVSISKSAWKRSGILLDAPVMQKKALEAFSRENSETSFGDTSPRKLGCSNSRSRLNMHPNREEEDEKERVKEREEEEEEEEEKEKEEEEEEDEKEKEEEEDDGEEEEFIKEKEQGGEIAMETEKDEKSERETEPLRNSLVLRSSVNRREASSKTDNDNSPLKATLELGK